ncbi:MAG: rod shape-determining protein, partial [Planctomycetes bacterium]|nr:rod shape-determining protein [Planctomycetota bacterium]
LREPVSQIIDCVTRTLEKVDPELAADLIENGVSLVGGGGLLRGLDKVLSAATGLDVEVVEDALSCVARGTAIYLENLATWKDTLESDANGI